MSDTPTIQIPTSLLPRDGRFGSGPSKVRQEAVVELAAAAPQYLGNSHRKPTIQNTIGRLREALAELFNLPEGYEVILGNGGAAVFWDIATASLIEEQSEHLVCGEFSAKFASFVNKAPYLKDPFIVETEVGTRPQIQERDDVDFYALIQNETSTGVVLPIEPITTSNAISAVDATSAAGGIAISVDACDVYYFSPQKCFGADGGMWFALASPSAMERSEHIASQRPIPTTLNFSEHVGNSRANTTFNTPSLVNLFLTLKQTEWFLSQGGLSWTTKRCRESSDKIYGWAEDRDFATPFVASPEERSPVTCTIDFVDIDANAIAAVLRHHGITDIESYRKLGRNQLRIATFPAIEPSDIDALLACIDYVVEHL